MRFLSAFHRGESSGIDTTKDLTAQIIPSVNTREAIQRHRSPMVCITSLLQETNVYPLQAKNTVC